MKNESIRKVINVDRPNYSPVWNFKQEDDGVIKLALFKDSTALNITGQTIKLCAKRPNNSIVELEEQSNFEINNNELDITLKNNILAVPGVVECDLEIVDAVGKMTTASFYLTVSKKMTGNENIEASNDISAINKIVAEVEAKALKLDTDIKNLVIEANKKIMQIESAANIQLEEIQADYEAIKQVVNKDENIRKSNEAIRVNNESNRVSAESLRAAAETKRAESESNRISAEETRALEFNKIKEENDIFKQDVDKQILNSKTDYFGKEHLSVDERLNEDFDNVHQRINDSSLLEYEGCNISADNSYYGLTKDMVVKGRTLQNLVRPNMFELGGSSTLTDGYLNLYHSNTENVNRVSLKPGTCKLFKPNTKYTMIIDIVSNNTGQPLQCSNTVPTFTIFKDINNRDLCDGTVGRHKVVVTTIEDLSVARGHDIYFCFWDRTGTDTNFIRFRVMIVEGDYTNTPLAELPYGEGIYSVGDLISEGENQGKYKVSAKSCGKNLFNINNFSNKKNTEYYDVVDDKILIKKLDQRSITGHFDEKSFINVLANQNYTISATGILPINTRILLADSNKVIIPSTTGVFNTGNNTRIDFKFVETTNYPLEIRNLQLEEGTQTTPYEPYQEDIKTYYLDEPLMSLPNRVKDEVVGNKLIRRVGKVVFDGSESWGIGSVQTDSHMHFARLINDMVVNSETYIDDLICDTFVSSPHSIYNKSVEGIHNKLQNIMINISKSKLSSPDVTGFKKWLSQNPVTVYYQLAEPIITVLDETLVLNTYDGTTHITSDNYLLPTISCKIPSNVQAVVSELRNNNNILTKEITNLSTENIELKDTNDIQDTLIDTTMMATDEMFVMLEPLLPNIPNTMNLKEVSKMVDLYVAMVMRGLKTIEEVPSRYREEVARILSELEK